MHTIRMWCAFLFLAAWSSAFAQQDKPVSHLSDLPEEAQSSISAVLGRDLPEYAARTDSHVVEIANSRQHLSARFTDRGVEVRAGSATWGISVRGYGYGDALQVLQTANPTARQNRIEYDRGNLTEWYLNGPAGLEQGFTLNSAPSPATGQVLTVSMTLSGDMAATIDQSATRLNLSNSQTHLDLQYTSLTARDAAGNQLHAWLEMRDHDLLLKVDDSKARYPLVIDPTLKQARLTNSDEDNGQKFGYSVAISGNTLVIGSPGANGQNNQQEGAAYVFLKPATGGWADATENAKLVSSDGVTNDEFGYSVAISGDHIAVGAPDHSALSSLCGEAYYFTKPVFGGWSGTISETASLGNGHNKNAFLGTSVGISGQWAIVGSPGEDSAYLLICATNVPSCGLDATFYGVAGPEPQFGTAVAMSGTTFVVTDPYATVGVTQFQGAAYVYTYVGGNSFSKATLTSSDGGFLDEMGMSVAISNNTVVVGCPFCMQNGFYGPGAAYVYTKPQNGWVDATQTAKLTSSDGVSEDTLGTSVAVSGRVIVAGAPNKTIGQNAQQGEAYIYIQPTGGWRDQTENIHVLASDGALFDYFGGSVATNGTVAVVGAQGGKNTNLKLDSGTTYVYSQ